MVAATAALPWIVAAACSAAVAARVVFGTYWFVWFAAGLIFSCMRLDSRLADRVDAALAGQDVRLAGWVDSFPRTAGRQVSFSLRVVDTAATRKLPARVRLTWYDAPLEIVPGMDLALTVRLRQPHGLLNPGGFDYERWLFIEGYGATGYVRAGERRVDATARPARAWLERRAAIAARIREAVPDADAAALLSALAIGERHAFEERHWTTLRRTGTSHLVAISGLHVGIVAALVFFLCRCFWVRGPQALAAYDLEAAALASFVAALGYAALAGFAVPTQRALIMLGAGLLALVSRRTTTMVAGLSAALLFVLIWDPLAPISPSFWLSFAAVTLIWQLGSVRTTAASGLAPWRRWWRRVVRTQLGITIGLLPIVAIAFGEVSIVAPVANLIAIPFFSLALVPLTLIATLALAFEPAGSVLFGCAATLTQFAWAGLTALGAHAWAATALPALGIGQIALLLAGAAIALPAHALPGRHLGWLIVLAPLLAKPARPALGAFDATVLDVGHGLAVVIRTREHTLLYDAGARFRSGFDSGREIVVPALRSLGVGRLDRIVISHADNDHTGGLDAVLGAVDADELIVGPDMDRDTATICTAGMRWTWNRVVFEFLHPPPDFIARGNDSSCVLRVSATSGSLLLTGDIEARGERTLLSQPVDLGSDIVIVPHHGSATSSTAAFTARVAPQAAIVSAGFANQWGFPRARVRDRWEGVGAQLLVTGHAGAVAINFPPTGSIELATQRGQWPLPWRIGPDS